MRTSKRIRFPNGRGQQLAGIVDVPAKDVWAWSVFTHCFTCSKDLKAIVWISRRLAEQGIGVLRFDCTGLGDSQGDFGATNFSTTCLDLLAAAQFMAAEYAAPAALIGHSFGGAASLACAKSIASIRAVATIAAPSDTRHLAAKIARQNPAIDATGEGDFSVGGQTYRLRRPLLDDLRGFDFEGVLARMDLPHFIVHSPVDETLEFEHALALFRSGGGPKLFVTLDGADHLLVNRPGDAEFVAELLATWLARVIARSSNPRIDHG
jgi:putative redox protein